MKNKIKERMERILRGSIFIYNITYTGISGTGMGKSWWKEQNIPIQ